MPTQTSASSTLASEPRKLSMWTMASFGFGQTAEGVKAQAFNVFLLFYYTQVIGISGTMAGTALAIALVFDAVTDPMVGIISDRFRSKWGRRHPFLMASAVPLFVAFYALYSPPDGLTEFQYFLWLTTFAVLVRGALTFYHVPHLALGAEMTHDYDQRSTAFAFSTVFSITGMAVVSIVGYKLFFPTTEQYAPGTLNPEAYSPFALCFALIMLLSIVVCCVGTFKEIPHLRQNSEHRPITMSNILGDYGAVFANRSYRLIFFGMLLSTFAVAVETIFSPFMGVHFWGLPTERLGDVGAATLIGLWIGLPLASVITRKLGKRWALVLPAVIIVVNANVAVCLRLFDVSWFPENGSPAIFWIYFSKYLLQGICLPVLFATFNSMFADIADELELETGNRLEGVIYASRSFANKAASALGAILGGYVLDLIAFPKGAVAGSVPPDTLWWLGLTEGPLTSGLALVGVLFYLRYKIDRKRHGEIVVQLAARKAEIAAAS